MKTLYFTVLAPPLVWLTAAKVALAFKEEQYEVLIRPGLKLAFVLLLFALILILTGIQTREQKTK